MNSTTTPPISQYAMMQTYIARYFMMPLYVFGILGNVANVILFSQRRIRLNNACVRYFIALSSGNLLIIIVCGFSRSLPYLNGFNPETASLIFCKCRLYIVHSTFLFARACVSLISIDRWMITSSNPSIRQLSTPKNAHYIIIVVALVSALFNSHALVGFEIRSNVCYAYGSTAYLLFYSIYNVVTAILPVAIMVFFGILIMGNIRRSQTRINTVSSKPGNHSQPSSQPVHASRGQFVQLAIMQSFTFTLLNIGYAVYVSYDAATFTRVKSAEQRALEGFLYGLCLHPVYIFCAVS